MGYIRERYDLFNSIEIREHMDCRHKEEGARCEKRKRTPEEMKRANQRRKEEKARRLIWANFEPGDYVRTLTFKKDRRPADMKEAQSIKAKFRPGYAFDWRFVRLKTKFFFICLVVSGKTRIFAAINKLIILQINNYGKNHRSIIQ